MKQLKCIAYYLGQFHPIHENNEFWGDGFTEWHNVAKARPLFPGHIQPVLPGSLGFYDLRCDDTLREQIDLATDIGIDAFCHWHYWFAGRRLLHAPLDRMITIGHKNFRFILGWANESWAGVWHGAPKRVLIEQRYNKHELLAHAELISRYITSGYYLEVDGTFPFVIYKPNQIPDSESYLGHLKQEVQRLTGANLYLIGNWAPGRLSEVPNPSRAGLDAVVITPVAMYYSKPWLQNLYSGSWQILRKFRLGPEVRPFSATAKVQLRAVQDINGVAHSTIVTGWDNTPRSGRRGLVLSGYCEDSFRHVAELAVDLEVRNERPILFVKSWNEWAEGNVLEPRFQERWSPYQVLKEVLEQGGNTSCGRGKRYEGNP
jgi:hypothetical protein